MTDKTKTPINAGNTNTKRDDEQMEMPAADSGEIHHEYFLTPYEPSDDLLADAATDAQGLGYRPFRETGTMGYVESVNGRGAVPCPEFDPTRFELLVIAKHWYRQLCEVDLFWHQHQTTGSTEWRIAEYANRRLFRIRRLIGDEPVDKVIAEVDAEFRDKLGGTEWELFQAMR